MHVGAHAHAVKTHKEAQQQYTQECVYKQNKLKIPIFTKTENYLSLALDLLVL